MSEGIWRCILQTTQPGLGSDIQEQTEWILRSDIVLLSETHIHAVMLEVTVPWEDRMDKATEGKKARYADTVDECHRWGWLQRICKQGLKMAMVKEEGAVECYSDTRRGLISPSWVVRVRVSDDARIHHWWCVWVHLKIYFGNCISANGQERINSFLTCKFILPNFYNECKFRSFQ